MPQSFSEKFETGENFENSEYIEIKDAFIHKNDIPMIVRETSQNKILKAVIFYSIFIFVILVLLYECAKYSAARKETAAQKSSAFFKHIHPQKKYKPVKATGLKLYNLHQNIPLEHIILIDVYNNVIDIDAHHNYFLQTHKIANGTVYSIDFGSVKNIKEVIITLDYNLVKLSPYKNFGIPATLELYNNCANNCAKTWCSNVHLTKKENNIPLYEEVFTAPLYSLTDFLDGYDNTKLVINENSLAVQLGADGNDHYASY